MAKRKTQKTAYKRVPRKKQVKIDWQKILAKQTKAVLMDELIDLIKDDRRLERRLMQRFQITVPQEMLIQETRRAIADATDYDERESGYNFDYDYGAYDTVQKNFAALIKAGSLDTAMELALELMTSGSEQVESSDEGLMTNDIEECLRVVIKGLKKADLPKETIPIWARQMLDADRVQFICDEELGVLAK
jgi:hypothetical protein